MVKSFLPLACLGLGLFLTVQVVMPIISLKILEISLANQNTALVNPLPKSEVLGISVQNNNSFPALVSDHKRAVPPPYSTFVVSIPAINLDEAVVRVETNDFDENLAHLPGSAIPGERGNVFITGHSSLPQLFKTDNYKAIFSYLPKVKKGDEILIHAGGNNYTYVVKNLKIVDPSQTWVINPPDNSGRYLSLMTCVPPGLYLKRLIVLAELKS